MPPGRPGGGGRCLPAVRHDGDHARHGSAVVAVRILDPAVRAGRHPQVDRALPPVELGDRFQGSAALEYGPLAPLEQDLADMRKMTNFA